MNIQSLLSWLQNNTSWLQVVAAIFQAFASVVAIPAAIVAARWGASRAYKLLNRQEREKLDEQVKSLRLLLDLEIQRSFNSLQRFQSTRLIRLAGVRADDEGAGTESGTAEKRESRDIRQHFITLYMPELSSHFWYSQHLSPLLPVALSSLEIRRADDIYSNFERRAQIKSTLAGRAGLRSASAVFSPAEGLTPEELEDLLNEFDTVLNVTLEMSNPFRMLLNISDGAHRVVNLPDSAHQTRRSKSRVKLDSTANIVK